MKRLMKVCAMASVLSSVPAWGQGIPVYDNASVLQALEQFRQLQQQYSLLQDQLKQAEEQIRQFEGARDYADAIGSVYERDYEADVNSILDDYGYVEDRETVEQESREIDAQHLGEVDHYLEQTNQRYDELSRLISEVDSATDPKDVMDLQARIQAEQAMLQNEQLKVQLLSQRHEMQSEMQQMKREERHEQAWESGTNIDAFSFE